MTDKVAGPDESGLIDGLGAGSEARKSTIADDDVYWLMTWGERFPNKPPTELIFEDGKALARLLAEEVIFLNSHWWEKDWLLSFATIAAVVSFAFSLTVCLRRSDRSR